MREYAAGISRIEHRGAGAHLLELSCDELANEALPGQFVQVRAGNGTDPFLRRTFSLCDADPKTGIVLLLVDSVGPGTEMLCSLKRGGVLDVVGPLGRGFDLANIKNARIALVAGGSGAAPLVFLARHMNRDGSLPMTLMMGGRTAEHVRMVEGLLPDGCMLLMATDDGSRGFHGLVTGLFSGELTTGSFTAVATCGPYPMMRETARIAAENSMYCQVSLEERMACGFGVCLGCAVETTGGRMVRSCTDGPVFDAREIVWI